MNIGRVRVHEKDFRDRGSGFDCCVGMLNAAVVEYPNPLRCSFTNYEEPCTCEKEPNFIKKSYCELKMKQSNKMTRGEAASVCARRAEEYSKEIGAEYYKDCMKDEGF